MILTLSVIIIVLGSYYAYIRHLRIDLHVMEMGNMVITFALSYFGIYSVLILADVMTKVQAPKSFFSFWGCNSLFVMITHEYFLMRRLFKFSFESFSIVIPDLLSPYVFTILTLVVEIPLIYLFSEKANRVINYLAKKIYCCKT